MGAGGAQTTLRRLGVLKRTFVLQSGQDNNLFKLTKEIFREPRKIILCAWLYHAAFIACLLKIIFFKKVILIINIRNGYASPDDLKLTTRLIIKALSIFAAYLANRVNFCSLQSLKEHNSANLFKKTNNHIIYNGIATSNELIFKQQLKFCIIARFEPQKNYALLREVLYWFDENKIDLTILTDQKAKLSTYLDIHEYEYVKIVDNFETSAPAVLAEATHHLLLSKSEGFANVNLEALNHGCSLICTAVGDAKIFPEKWCSIVSAEKNDVISVLDSTLKAFNRHAFNMETVQKRRYLKQHFFPKTELEYTNETTCS